MKLGLLFIGLVTLAGCAAHPPQVQSAAEAPLPNRCEARPCDAFDTVGDSVATGTRYAWDETKQAWAWVRNDENKERAQKVWQATKDAASKAYDKAVESYNK